MGAKIDDRACEPIVGHARHRDEHLTIQETTVRVKEIVASEAANCLGTFVPRCRLSHAPALFMMIVVLSLAVRIDLTLMLASMTVKQKPLQSASPIRSKLIVFTLLCFSCIASYGGRSVAMADDAPPKMDKTLGEQAASLRLIDGTGLDHGTYAAGVEITMSPGSHTYWKMPGDAGVPPVFAFNGSENVDSATVLFPAPTRIVQDGLEAFGYEDRVVFPVMIKPKDAAKPSVLHADVTYAVCNKICLPEHTAATLTLQPGGTGGSVAPIDAALAKVPVPISPAEREKLSITRDRAAKKPTWTLAWTGATPVEDIFADAPEGFYFDTHKLGAGHLEPDRRHQRCLGVEQGRFP